ncbi:MAG TPA: hypothetical protein VKA30_04460 [Actinomycetota bacterium]|nr:hypothetical protein [Actinomycetota bacterium]
MRKRIVALIVSASAVFGLLFATGGGSSGALGAANANAARRTCIHIDRGRLHLQIGYCP